MKALSVRQPWAWSIARGWKPVENRRWTTHYRGPLAIHAARRWDDNGDLALQYVEETARAEGHTLPPVMSDDEPYCGVGRVLAVVDLVDICTAALAGQSCRCGPWAFPAQAHWKLANPRPLNDPFEIGGRLMLWNLDLLEGAL